MGLQLVEVLMSCRAASAACEFAQAMTRALREAGRTCSVGPTHFFFPELDYAARKFTRPDACAAAGFRPHFK
jgi:hypothetical protein